MFSQSRFSTVAALLTAAFLLLPAAAQATLETRQQLTPDTARHSDQAEAKSTGALLLAHRGCQ